MTHLTQSGAIAEGDVSVVCAQHTSVTCYLIQSTGDINVGNNVLNKYGTIGTTYKSSEVDVCYVCTSFDTQVADGSILDKSEEATPLILNILVLIGNGKSLTIKYTAERI